MEEPVLVIMAAGMGSRYGGLKQIDPIDEEGHIIIDFSLYDAMEAGFKKVIFIIKREMEEEFKEVIGDRMSSFFEVDYAYQELNRLPEGFQVPEGRVKPWGTGHAILSCQGLIDGPFAVINADDYYGKSAFSKIYGYLSAFKDENRYCMVGYRLKNTLTEHGYVARGVCQVSEKRELIDIHERTQIEKRGEDAAYTDDGGATYTELSGDSMVSMNLWGFTKGILTELEERFRDFLRTALVENPLKGEYFLPNVVGELVKEKKVKVDVLSSHDRWYGVTYKEDKPVVIEAIKELKRRGLYPEQLWRKQGGMNGHPKDHRKI